MLIRPQQILSPTEYRHVLRNDFLSFAHAAFYELNPSGIFKHAPHLEVIASALEACWRGEIKRLIINLPPRSLKSHCASIAFVAWILGLDPTKRIICASYGQELADKLARDTRNVMTSRWYQAIFATRMSERTAVHDFQTEQLGFRFATSVGGSLTGIGGDYIIIDDPLKPEDALSETRRSSVNEWYDNTLLSRLNQKDQGCIIIVQQRLHQDDLVGHVSKHGNWHVLSFPAIADTDALHVIRNPFGSRIWKRKAGDVLHPERESLEVLIETRRSIGEYNYVAQYLQNPMPLEGYVVKSSWLKYYAPGSEPGKFWYIVQSWDTANKAGQLNDYSVCTTWGVDRENIYLLHVFRKKLNFPDLKRAVLELRDRYRPHRILIEDKASGTQLIQELQRSGANVVGYSPPSGTDKLMRLHAQTTYFESGRVHLREGAQWLEEYVAELTGFPGCKFDDQVDSTTQFLDHHRHIPPPMRIHPDALRAAKRITRWRRLL